MGIDPTYPSAYNNRGIAWYRRGDFDRAIADDEAIQLEPNYGHAYVNRGGAWGDKGDFDRAIKDFVQAIRLDPKSAQATTTAAWLGKRSAVYERHWPISKCILNSLLPTRMALRL